MPTNLPGVTSYGIPLFGQGSVYDMPSGRVWFVCNRTGATITSAPAGTSRDAPFASLADAVANVATTLPTTGDVIYVLAGHAENVTGSNLFSGSATLSATAAVFPAGLRIIGEGDGNQRPTFTFTAAASSLAFAAAGVSFENCVLLGPQTGTTTVAAMFTVTAANCAVLNCNFNMATSATALVTTGISLSSAANEFVASGNLVWGLTGTPTSWLSNTGTTGPNRVQVSNNNVQLLLTATTSGCVDFSAASVAGPLNILVTNNSFINQTAASTVAMKFSANATGMVAYNSLGTTNASATACMGTTTLLQLVQNFVSQPNKFGLIAAAGGTSA